jgi:hypothetical protein
MIGEPPAKKRRQHRRVVGRVPVSRVRLACRGDTLAAAQRQFQFRSLSGDPRVDVYLDDVFTQQRGIG